MNKKNTRVFALVWGAVMIAVLSSTLTMLFTGRTAGSSGAHWVSQAEYDRIERYARLDEVRETLMNQYYQPLDEEALKLGAIRGMAGAVEDIYTFYYTPEELERENENERGEYVGVGILIEQDPEGMIKVLRVYPDTPAAEAGIRVGDRITAVDHSEVSTQPSGFNEAADMIRGEAGTEVLLTVLRDGAQLDVPVMRKSVNVSYVDYCMLEDSIGYAAITQFTGDAADRFDEAIEYFKAQGARGMVIDVRNNPGGLLTHVNRIADSLLPEGVIVYIQDREGSRTDYYSDSNMYDVPLAVLVNDMSASASEILAASVQALDRGVVVGVKTYGKGIVQTLIPFDDGSGIQLTTSSYYDADGRSIHGVGVTPDIEVALTGERIPIDPDPVSDNQLAEAIRAVENAIGSGE